MRVLITPMEDKDIEQVAAIEKVSFPTAWSINTFRNELHKNRLAHYFVARIGEKVVGYGGMWMVMDEAHITTLAVDPDYRGIKIGQMILHHLLVMAVSKNMRWATLEVRQSNNIAQNLYKKYGFTQIGIRKNYYAEEKEDAIVMWVGNLRGEAFKSRLKRLKEELNKSFIAS